MKDNIIELENGLEFYVLDEIINNEVKYLFCVQTAEETNNILENYIICKVANDLNGNEYIKKVSNNDIYERISNIFLERLKNN